MSMYAYGGTSAVNNYLYLISSDMLLDENDDKIGKDLLRRLFASFFYFGKATGDTHENILLNTYTFEEVKDLIDRSRYVSNMYSTTQPYIQYAAINPARISTVDNTVDIPNLKIPFRLYASKDEHNVRGDYHWKQLFMGGDFGGNLLPTRFDSTKIFYNSSVRFLTPHQYDAQRKYEALSLSYPPDEQAKVNIFSNYDEYNHLVQNYQDWTTNLNSELLIPNFNLIAEHMVLANYGYPISLFGRIADLAFGMDTFGDMTVAEAARDDSKELYVKLLQKFYSKTRIGTIRYHFPRPDLTATLKKDEYFGSYIPNTTDIIKYNNDMLLSQQNIIFPNDYFKQFLRKTDTSILRGVNPLIYLREIVAVKDADASIKREDITYSAPEADATNIRELLKATGYGSVIANKLSTFYNVEINFTRHTNERVPNVPRESEIFEEYIEDTPARRLVKVDNNDAGTAVKLRNQFIRKIIESSGFSEKMLETLKDIDEGTITDVPVNLMPYNFIKTLEEPGEGSTYKIERPESAVGLKTINFMDFLSYSYNNIGAALNENYTILGAVPMYTNKDDTISRIAQANSIVRIFDASKDLMKQHLRNLDPRNLSEIETSGDTLMESLNKLAIENVYGPTFRPYEVVAYKIEKIGGTPSGDSSQQDVLQKFWIYNSTSAGQELSIIDSQVKYGKNYTYKISAYVLVLGIKYRYGDLRLTKQIGVGDYFADDIEDSGTRAYCVQFYDPITSEISPQLFAEASTEMPDDHPAKSTLSGLNPYSLSSVEITQYPQLADFNLYVEPCLELVEIPMVERQLKVLDNPCNSININPFHFIDDTNRLGFQASQESFIKRPYPELITPEDVQLKSDYLNSKELMDYNYVQAFSESPARTIEIYRIKKRPTSFFDFNENLVATVDLRIKNEFYNYSNKIIADQIKTNIPYYYVFRFVSENGMPGPLSQIIKSEIVNDGGYTYALFDTVDSSEFNPNTDTTKDVSFKKIMQLEPNMSQLYFDETDVDYDNNSSVEVSNLIVGLLDTSIFDHGRRFKVRLTSKKTDKKIDLNINYNLITRDLNKSTYIDLSTVPEGSTDMPWHEDLDIGVVELSGGESIGDFTIGGVDETITTSVSTIRASDDYVSTIDTGSASVSIAADEEDGEEAELSDAEAADLTEVFISTDPADESLGIDPAVQGRLVTSGFSPLYGSRFVVGHYRFVTGATRSYPDSPSNPEDWFGTSLYETLIYPSVNNPDIWDVAGNDFTPAYKHGLAMHELLTAIYSERSNSKMIIPLMKDEMLSIVALALPFYHVAAVSLHGTDGAGTDARWDPASTVGATGAGGDTDYDTLFNKYWRQARQLLDQPSFEYFDVDTYENYEEDANYPAGYRSKLQSAASATFGLNMMAFTHLDWSESVLDEDVGLDLSTIT